MSEPDFKITCTAHGLDGLKLIIHSLSMTPEDRRKFNYYMGKEVELLARGRQRNQVDLDGMPWKRRSQNSTRKGKMMRKLLKSKNMKVRSFCEYAEVGWKNPVMGSIAKRQQEGTLRKPGRRKSEQYYDDPCTRKQAHALIREGYRKPMRGGNPKRVSVKYIMENMTKAQAGVILKNINEGETSTHSTSKWFIPARPFLGASKKEQQEIAKKVAKKVLQRIAAQRSKSFLSGL